MTLAAVSTFFMMHVLSFIKVYLEGNVLKQMIQSELMELNGDKHT